MPSAHDRTDFAPPQAQGSVRAFALALLVHVLLIAALTWGVNWKQTDQSIGYEAEIWSAVPQMVAPRLVEATPAPAPAPPPPPPQPEVKAPPVKVTPPAPDVDIAMEQEKKRRLLAQQKEEAETKLLAERQRALEVAKKAKEKELKAREDQAKRLAVEEAKKAQAQLDTQNAQKAKELAKAQDAEKQAQAALQKQREDNINRIKGLAGASGGANDTGAALRATGPSASYAGKLNAAIRPNVVFSGEISGNPVTTVEVRVMSDGTVISQRVIKSSGDKNWDDAAINAVIRTRVLPRDENGRMPDTIMHVEMRPRG